MRHAILVGIGLRPHPIAPTALLCALLLGACGAGGSDTPAASTPTPPADRPAPQAQGTFALPRGVPLSQSRAGDPAAIKVIRLWSEAMRRSDLARASALWAVPSQVQNGTPLLTLASTADVRAFNGSLSCGSTLTSALGARNGFTIAVFRLTRRPGADCGSGTGAHARTAIRVRNGKIAEWYRLPDDPGAPAPQQPATPQEPAGPIV